VRKLAGQYLNLHDEAGGKSGPYAGLEAEPPGRACGREQITCATCDDQTRRVQSGCDDITGQAFICEKDDLGANHIAIRVTYIFEPSIPATAVLR
jgi:hypothetical protein